VKPDAARNQRDPRAGRFHSLQIVHERAGRLQGCANGRLPEGLGCLDAVEPVARHGGEVAGGFLFQRIRHRQRGGGGIMVAQRLDQRIDDGETQARAGSVMDQDRRATFRRKCSNSGANRGGSGVTAAYDFGLGWKTGRDGEVIDHNDKLDEVRMGQESIDRPVDYPLAEQAFPLLRAFEPGTGAFAACDDD
jgi:hypothetical protein